MTEHHHAEFDEAAESAKGPTTDFEAGYKLVEPIAELLAGDLSPAEAQHCGELVKNQPDLSKEHVFWQAMLPSLADCGRPVASIKDLNLASVVHKRLNNNDLDNRNAAESLPVTTKTARHAPHAAPLAFSIPPWIRYLTTAAAAALFTVFIFQAGISSQRETQTRDPDSVMTAGFVAYNEHGDAILVPRLPQNDVHATLYQDAYLPLHQVDHLDVAQAQNIAYTNKVARPYLGLLIKPITLDNSDQETGALVLQVFGGSPAEKAGIEPGDVLLLLAECPMATGYCIPHALKNKVPGEKIDIIYVDQSTNLVVPTTIVLGATYE